MLPLTAEAEGHAAAPAQAAWAPTRAELRRSRLGAALAIFIWIVICLHPLALIALSFYRGWL